MNASRAVSTAALVRPAAIEANVRRLLTLANGAAVCAVVKADGYGHGVVTASRAAVAGGATWLAVATVDEALEVAGSVEGVVPVLILSELTPAQAQQAAGRCSGRIRFTVASVGGIEALSASAGMPCRVHVKIDTGMHRMGADRGDLTAVAGALRAAAPALQPEAVWTHLAVADVPDDPFTAEQLVRFDAALEELRSCGVEAAMTHAANSAGAIAHPASRRDLVRTGICCYGVPPSLELEGSIELEPALSLVSRVSAVRTVAPGESVSYGRRWHAEAATRVATVGIGYADGVRRDSGAAGVDVLVRGRRCPIVGAVTMDQMMVALHPAVADWAVVGDEVVLIGRQGAEEVTATEIAVRLGTIAYEVLTGLSARVPRLVV